MKITTDSAINAENARDLPDFLICKYKRIVKPNIPNMGHMYIG